MSGSGSDDRHGAALFRLRPQDFGEIRHHGGLGKSDAEQVRANAPRWAGHLDAAGRARTPRGRLLDLRRGLTAIANAMRVGDHILERLG